MISELRLQHFKSVEDATVAFDPVTVFVGNNGSGKSNIVDALRFLKDAATQGLDRAFTERHGIESVRQWSPTRPYRMQIEVTVRSTDFWGKYELAIDTIKGGYKVSSEYIEIREFVREWRAPDDDDSPRHLHIARLRTLNRNGDGKVTQHIGEGPRQDGAMFQPEAPLFNALPTEEFLDIPRIRVDELVLNNFFAANAQKLSEIVANFQAYSIYPNTLRLPQEPSNERFLLPDGRNLTSVLKAMRRTTVGMEAIEQITTAMRNILPGLETISILGVGGYLVPQFHMKEAGGKTHKFNVAQMSDGTLRVLGLLTALYQRPKPGIIVLEEPEQTVNPAIMEVLADSIKEVSGTRQVIVTTHSPHLLDQFDPEQIRAVDMVEGRTQVSRVGPTQMGVVHDRLFSLGELLVSEGLHGG
jgi:predicted ATPase